MWPSESKAYSSIKQQYLSWPAKVKQLHSSESVNANSEDSYEFTWQYISCSNPICNIFVVDWRPQVVWSHFYRLVFHIRYRRMIDGGHCNLEHLDFKGHVAVKTVVTSLPRHGSDWLYISLNCIYFVFFISHWLTLFNHCPCLQPQFFQCQSTLWTIPWPFLEGKMTRRMSGEYKMERLSWNAMVW